MKKKIKIEVIDKFPGVDETFNTEENNFYKDRSVNRVLSLVNAIMTRINKPMFVESDVTFENSDEKNYAVIEVEITQNEYDSLPIGLKKLLI